MVDTGDIGGTVAEAAGVATDALRAKEEETLATDDERLVPKNHYVEMVGFKNSSYNNYYYLIKTLLE